MNPIAQLLDYIRRHKGVTVWRTEFLNYYDCCFPEWRNDPEREVRCRHALEELSQSPFFAITLPSEGTAQARSRNYQGSLPRFVRKVMAKPVSVAKGGEDNWLPRLADLAATLRGGRLKDLRCINEFLKERPGPLPLVPYRERSLQIFGDEKAIGERLPIKGDALFGGRLPLAQLGACNPPLPFPFTMPDPPCPGGALLVVENHHTFASMVVANDRQRVFAAVAWGGGNAFTKGCAEYVDTIVERAKAAGVMYLGDLDPKGIVIPATVDRARRDVGLSPIMPARAIYSWLLSHGIVRSLAGTVSDAAHEAALAWLGEEMGQDVLRLWSQGRWIPQESLGAEALAVYGSMLA